MPSVTDVIIHCQKQIKKEPPEEKLLHYLSRLDRLRVAVQDLMNTGVGRTVNQLSRCDGLIGHVARKLVRKWKAMVSDENSEESEDSQSSSSSGDEDEEDEGQKPIKSKISKGTEKNRKHGLGHRRGSDNLEELPHRLNGRDYPDDPESDVSDRLCIADEDSAAVLSQDPLNIVIKKENIAFLPSNSSGESASEEENEQPDKIDHFGIEPDTLATQSVISKSNGRLKIEKEYHNISNNNQETLKAIICSKSSRKQQSSGSEEESSSEESHVKQGAVHDNKNKKHLDQFNLSPGISNGSRNSDDQHQKLKKVQPEYGDERERESRKSLPYSGLNQIQIKKEVEEYIHKDHHRQKTTSDVPRGRHSSKEQRSESYDRKDHKHTKDKSTRHEESRKPHRNPETKDCDNISVSNIKVKVEPTQDLHEEHRIPNGLINEKVKHEIMKHSSKHKDKSNRKEEDRKERHSKHKHKEHRDKDKHRSKDRDGSREGRRKHDKDTDKHERKRKGSESKDKTRSKSSSSPDHKKPKLEGEGDSKKQKDKSSSKLKKPAPIVAEIDSTSGVNFEDALGSLDQSMTKITSVKKENRDKSNRLSVISQSSSSRKLKEEGTKLNKIDLDKMHPSEEKKKKSGMKHLESVIAPTLNISPFYKPSGATTLLSRSMTMTAKPPALGNFNLLEQCDPGNYWEDSRISLSQGSRESASDSLVTMTTSRNQRTKVYSGNKVVCTGEVPRLFDLCMQVIQENIQDLGYTGGVPFDILKPALERASAQQLFVIEECNPYLIGETDDLWKFHSKREFRGRDPQELESWRELYERCIFERDEKFAIVRKKVLKTGEIKEPVRKAILAYVEPVGGTRFNRHKATTIKNGMRSLKIKEEKGPKKGVGTSASVGFNNPVDGFGIVEEQGVIINPDSKVARAARPSVARESTARVKPRRAPLMAKTMKFIKTLTRR